MKKEVRLMKGNEVIAEAAIRCGADAYYGYPITPQSEVMETLMDLKPWETTGMVVLQAESEIAAANMVYAAAGTGKKIITSSSSPGISLMAEAFSYIGGAELPCVFVNVTRGGPGLGTIQPSQGDYFQATKAPGHGDFHMIVLAPNSVQEMHDFVFLGFELAFKYRNPVMILTDGVIGQMMEKVVVSEQVPRWTAEEIEEMSGDWALTGKKANRKQHIITSLEMDPLRQEVFNNKLVEKYEKLKMEDVRFETYMVDDAEYLIVAFGSAARISTASVDMAREAGYKVGLIRPITLYPFPTKIINELANNGTVKGILTAELNTGQMVEDVKLAANGAVPVEHYGRAGGAVFTPDQVYEALLTKIIKK